MDSADRSVLRRIKRLVKDSDLRMLGQRVKNIRQGHGLSIRGLAERAAVSKTSLVRIEGGLPVQPRTILRVCSALGLHIDRLQGDNPPDEALPAVHKGSDDRWFDLDAYGRGPLAEGPLTPAERSQLHLPALMLMLKVRPANGRLITGIIELYGTSERKSHPGEEIAFVLSGTAEIKVGPKKYVLQPGQCIGFWGSEEHSYGPAKGSELPVRLLCVRSDV